MSGMCDASVLRRSLLAALVFLGLSVSTVVAVHAEPTGPSPVAHRSLANNRIEWPSRAEVLRTLALRDYNTRVVLFGTTLLGGAAGIVGVFMLLRRRSLVGDVVSHSTLPGIAIAFMLMEHFRAGSGKWLPGLLLGALASGLLGIVFTKLILRHTRIKEDAALAIVLSVFFGLGMALFKVVQYIPSGSQAGLQHFILGKAASLVADDVWVIAISAAVMLTLLLLLYKEFTLLSFDERFAKTQGWPVFALDLTLLLLVAGVTVIGLQSVGLLLVVAMLIIPPAAARFWTNRLHRTVVVAGVVGGLSAAVGVVISALLPRLSAGAVIVLAGSTAFGFSLVFGTRRGVLTRVIAQRRLRLAVGRQHVLRAVFEVLEPRCDPTGELSDQLLEHIITLNDLLPMRSWTPSVLRRRLREAEQAELLSPVRAGGYRLTTLGAATAQRVVRNHRLWELYLIEYADIAPSHVDRDADAIEHILSPGVVAGLEKLLTRDYPRRGVPRSPHDIEVPAPGAMGRAAS